MSAWPSTLPSAPLARGFSEKPPKLTLRTQMDAGPAKVRKRFTAGVRPLTLQIKVTSAQVAIFDSFYLSDCGAGATPFTWVHPRTGAAASLRITDEPSYDPAGGDYWTITFNVEILP